MSSTERKNYQLFTAGATANCGSGASIADIWTLPIPYKCKVRKILAFVDNSASSTNATQWVVTFDIRPTAGSNTNRTTSGCGYIKRPATACNGYVVYGAYPLSNEVYLTPGEEMVVALATADGVTLQSVTFGFEVEYMPEEPSNISAMLAS